MDKEIVNILSSHGCKYMATDYKDLIEEIVTFVKEREQAINFIPCCTEVCDCDTPNVDSKLFCRKCDKDFR